MFNHILGLAGLPTASGASLSLDERKLHTSLQVLRETLQPVPSEVPVMLELTTFNK